MGIIKYQQIVRTSVEAQGVKGTSRANVVGPEQGWEGHTLRVFRLEPGGCTPHHQHDWEHVNHVIAGRGRLKIGEQVFELTAKDFAVVPPNTIHQFENPYDAPFEFICIVPNRGAY